MRWRALAMVVFSTCPPPPETPLPDASIPVDAGEPCFLVPSPEALDFGEVEIAAGASRRVQIANHSNRFVVAGFPSLDAPFTLSAVGPTRVAPSENLVLVVTFH